MKSFVTILMMLVLVACAGQPPEQREYLLRPPEQTIARDGLPPIRLLPVIVAPYLDQLGIVLQTSTTEVHVGKQNRWVEPLDRAVGRYLQVAIGNATGRLVEVAPLTTGRTAAEVRVRIQQFHGSADGDVSLVADWSITETDGVRRLERFASSIDQASNGYAGLVDAHAELLDRLALAIADSLGSG